MLNVLDTVRTQTLGAHCCKRLWQTAPQLMPLFTGEEPAAILPFDRPPRSAMMSEELSEEEQLVGPVSFAGSL